MTLLELQRRMAADLFLPLAEGDTIAPEADAGYIKPNNRLTSRERLEIYSRSYWYRVIDGLYDDFPGLRAALGERAFGRMTRAYLADCPSQSYTLRDLGSRLEKWLRERPDFAAGRLTLALDMIRLEWAHIEAFDGKSERPLGPEDLLELGPDLRFGLQPYIRLLELQYAVDDLRVHVARATEQHGMVSNAAIKRRQRGIVRRYQKMEPERIFLAVHRLDGVVYYRRLTIEQHRLLKALRAGKPIGEAIDSSVKNSPLPLAELQSGFQSWFTAWAQLGWFCQPKQK
jgi:hypothetical protein